MNKRKMDNNTKKILGKLTK